MPEYITSSTGGKDFIVNSDTVLKVWGAQVPKGTIRVSGAKNAALPLMAAGFLTEEKIHLDNFPTYLVDTNIKAKFLRNIGAYVNLNHKDNSIDIIAKNISPQKLENYNYPIRTTYLLAAGQLIRNGIAYIPYPGGCNIGERKYDLHIMIWKQMGCEVEEKDDYIKIKCMKLKPAKISFPFPTVGGTENAILCAAVTEGTTILKNAYIIPEIIDLILLLRKMGASIESRGNSQVIISGSKKLRGTSHTVIPDRIEALTWIIYSILSQGDVIIEDVPFDIMETTFIHLKEAGMDIFRNSKDVYINPKCLLNKTIQPFELACGTYPGIISDMQPFFVLFALKADGISRIIDYRYPCRTDYLNEIYKLCDGSLEWKSGSIKVKGVAKFKGANLNSTDLRGSMSAILGGLLAEGETTINNVSIPLRGYNNLLSKFTQLGIQYKLIL